MARYPIVSGASGGRHEFLRSSNKILSRQSSVSFSSRIYFRSSVAGFPFTWEMLPGEPKDKQPANDEAQMPPLSPPPALQSLSLPKPGVEEYLGNRKASASSPSKLLLKLWKKMSGKMSKRVAKRMALLGMNNDNDYVNRHRDLSISADSARDDVGARVDLVDLFEDFRFGSPVGSSGNSPPCNKAISSSSCSLSQCSSTSSAMQESSGGDAAGADENVNSRMPFARRSSWSLSRMVVVCTSGAKRV